MALINLAEKFDVIKATTADLVFSDVRISESFKVEFKEHINENSPSGYSDVEWAEFTAKITTSTGKSIILPNYWFYIAVELSEFLDSLSAHRGIFLAIFSSDGTQGLGDISQELKSSVSEQRKEYIENYFHSNSIPSVECDYFLRFVSDYPSWGGGKSLDRNDYYVSALLKAGNLLAETQGGVAELAQLFFQEPSLKAAFQASFVSPAAPIPTEALFTADYTQLPKPFLLLAGISGTGKTRFVREQAKIHGVGLRNFCLVPVRPDWHEPSDLLGYVSRVGAVPHYISTSVLQFVISAWKEIAPSASATGIGQLNLSCPPYWLCLDEMNLAPVEQYFADYLSVLESRNFEGGSYSCDPLLDSSVLSITDANVQADLGMEDDEELWKFFLGHGIPLPPNLIVAGTVNMDETTHGFSRKVIDRALTIDFGEFFPNDFTKIFGEQNVPKTFTYGKVTHITPQSISCPADPDGQLSIQFLNTVNDVLRSTPFELAYRALNELLLHVSSFSPSDTASLQAAWDDFLMTKVLPRIDGDEDKLRLPGGQGGENLLTKLEEVIGSQLAEIWGTDKTRKDFYSVKHDGAEITDIECRSRKKISWMKDRLEANTFTSYWP